MVSLELCLVNFHGSLLAKLRFEFEIEVLVPNLSRILKRPTERNFLVICQRRTEGSSEL